LRRQARERVFQTLFLMDARGIGPDEAIPLVALACPPPKDEAYYAATVRGVHERREEIDAMIRRAAQNWRLERMTLVDRNLLRMGTYEICYAEEVPYAVAINEAVDLAKRYGSAESGAFVNGILDRISEMARRKGEGAPRGSRRGPQGEEAG